MIQVQVAGVALDSGGQHVILLRPIGATPGAGRILPIWIGPMEATSIMVAVEGAPTPRPLAHDLLSAVISRLGAHVDKVEITHVDGGTFYAELTLEGPSGVLVFDARPSDAVALASRTSAPVWVADTVLEEAGVDDVVLEVVDPDVSDPDTADADADTAADGQDAPSPISGPEAEADVAEFTRFIDEVDPDDFRDE